MFAAYLDESFDTGRDGLYVVAAVVGTGWHVLEGERRWQQLLEKHQIRCFKASRLKKRPEIVTEFAAAIRDSGLIACGSIAEKAQVREHLNGSAFDRQYAESPYMLLYQQTFINIAMDFRTHGSEDLISFVCDEKAQYLGILTRSYPELKRLNKVSSLTMGSCTTSHDEECIPLQMADLIASELRKKAQSWAEGDTDFSEPLGLLIRSSTIWSVRRYDDQTLRLVRELVDQKARKQT